MSTRSLRKACQNARNKKPGVENGSTVENVDGIQVVNIMGRQAGESGLPPLVDGQGLQENPVLALRLDYRQDPWTIAQSPWKT